jgi:hypothetical protein
MGQLFKPDYSRHKFSYNIDVDLIMEAIYDARRERASRNLKTPG